MIRELRLDHFKTFERFTLALSKASFIVGPNNAGKSTLTGAIRATAQMVRHAHQRNPDRGCEDGGTNFVGYSLPTDRWGLPDPIYRHEFRRLETRLRLTYADRATVTAVWPVAEDEDDDAIDAAPFFYLRDSLGRQPRRAGEVRRGFPGIGIIPVLSPVDQVEAVLSSEHVRANSDTRLGSRHFRNHLWMLRNAEWPGTDDTTYEGFLDFVGEWTPEITIRDLEARGVLGEGQSLELWYSDRGRKAHKELAWVGDGMQIWLQILLHVLLALEGEL